MDHPPREALLDIEWLTRAHAEQGFGVLRQCVLDGAQVYGGPVTAVAEALHDVSHDGGRALDSADLRHVLAHALATGSWASAPTGGRSLFSCWQWLLPALPAEKRAEVSARHTPCDPPALPDLTRLELASPLDRAWIAHTDIRGGGIWACDSSLDGRYAVSASRDRSVSVWDMELGTLVARGPRGESEVRDCAVTPDGRRVIAMDVNGAITLSDLATMTVLAAAQAPPRTSEVFEHDYNPELRAADKRLWGSPRRWRRFAIAPDGSRLAVAGWEAIHIRDADSFDLVATLPIQSVLAPSPLGLFFASPSRLVTVEGRNPIPLVTWDINSGEAVARATLDVPPPPVTDIQRVLITQDRQFLIAASWAATTVWRMDDPMPVASAPYGVHGQALAISSDGTLAATSGDHPDRHRADVDLGQARGGVLRLWSLPDLRALASWNLWDLGCRDIACALAFTPCNTHLVVAGWDGVMRRLVLPTA